MVKKSMVIAALAVVTVAMLTVPAVNATSVTVSLNPKSDSATVDAYFNSTLTVNVSSTASLLSNLIKEMPGILPRNVSFGGSISNHSNGFLAVNSSLQEKDKSVILKTLSYNLASSVSNLSTDRYSVMVISTSAELAMNISGIFNNNRVNLSWRSFNVTNGVDISGSYNGIVRVNNTSVNVFNLSAFQVSLTRWSRTYDAATNVTTFSYNAGTTGNYSWTLNDRSVNISLRIDPSYTIATPGYAIASSNNVTLTAPPRSSSVAYYVIATILVIGAAVSFYFARRRH
ncbi:MAG: hypothetical protein QXN26_05265 [Thermoplasmataceae archaeon]